MKKKTILVTNDDGIYGPGLKPLVTQLKKIADVIVVVPDQERSGTSHSITLHKPLRIQKIDKNIFLANGSPADCVRYGALSLIKKKVDLVVSGINSGPNMGADVIYSGTVAGAREGCLLKIPSIAVSVAETIGGNFNVAAKTAFNIIKKISDNNVLPKDIYLNINIPKNVKGIKITSLGRRIYDDEIECRVDPRGIKYYWLAGKFVSCIHQPGTDVTVVKDSYVSITPLRLDPTALDCIEVFNNWIKNLN